MSDDDSDAEYERRYPQKRPGMPVWAILLIVLGATGFLGVLGLVALGAMFGATAVRPVPRGPLPVPVDRPEDFTFTRDGFEQAVMGKTPAEVKAAVGEPPMSVGADGEETWTYRGRTVRPDTNRPDGVAAVVFKGGKVIRVDHRDADPPPGPAPMK